MADFFTYKDTGRISPEVIKSLAQKEWSRLWFLHIPTLDVYGGRLSKGRTLLRKKSVSSFVQKKNRIDAVVQQSSGESFEVGLKFDLLNEELPQEYFKSKRIDTSVLAKLFAGELENSLMEVVCLPSSEGGLFPELVETKIRCTCLDDADICMHVAATLYAYGTLLDAEPSRLLAIRGLRPPAIETPSQFTNPQLDELSRLESIFGVKIDVQH